MAISELGDPIGQASELGPSLGPAALVDPLVNQTVIPKGGTPFQLTQSQAQNFALYDRLFGAAAQRQQALARERAADRMPDTNLAISAAKRMANNYLAMPSVAVDALSYPYRAPAGLVAQGRLPPLGITPQLSVDDLAAGLKSMTSPLTFNQARQNIDVAEGARETVHPTSTALGNVAGDIGTIVTTRLPLARGIVAATRSPDEVIAASRAAGMQPLGNWAQNAKRQFDIFWNSPWANPVKRGLGKVAETSGEAALLSMLHGDDPVKSAAFGAAGQTVGSMLMTAGLKYPLTAAGLGGIAGTIVAYQALKSEVPGGRDSIIKSAESVIGGMAGATVLGTIAAALGAGRFRGAGPAWRTVPGASAPAWLSHEQATGFPKITDAVNATLRTGPNSVITQILGDEKSKSPVLGPVLDKLNTGLTTGSTNLFKPDELDRIGKAVQAGNLRPTVVDMLKDPDFAARMAQ